MSKYKPESSRINIQIVDSDTEETIINIDNKNFLNVGEMFTERVLNSVIDNTTLSVEPDEIMVIAVSTFKKVR